MAGSEVDTDSLRQVKIVDPDIRKYLEARAKPPTPEEAEQEKELVGKWVARRKSDAKIVAFAEGYAALEERLEEKEIDPESVVIGVINDPAEVFID